MRTRTKKWIVRPNLCFLVYMYVHITWMALIAPSLLVTYIHTSLLKCFFCAQTQMWMARIAPSLIYYVCSSYILCIVCTQYSLEMFFLRANSFLRCTIGSTRVGFVPSLSQRRAARRRRTPSGRVGLFGLVWVGSGWVRLGRVRLGRVGSGSG